MPPNQPSGQGRPSAGLLPAFPRSLTETCSAFSEKHMVKLPPEFLFHIQSDPHATERLQNEKAFTELIAEHEKTVPRVDVWRHTRYLPRAHASLTSEARRARTLHRTATDMKYSVGISGPARPPRSPPRPHRRVSDRPGPSRSAPAASRPAGLSGPALTYGRRRSRLPPQPQTPPRVAAAAARSAAAAAQLPALPPDRKSVV